MDFKNYKPQIQITSKNKTPTIKSILKNPKIHKSANKKKQLKVDK